jgi:hypothetical protein
MNETPNLKVYADDVDLLDENYHKKEQRCPAKW